MKNLKAEQSLRKKIRTSLLLREHSYITVIWDVQVGVLKRAFGSYFQGNRHDPIHSRGRHTFG